MKKYMLSELCAELKNYFIVETYTGTFTISENMIETLPFLENEQYYNIKGSIFNDGVWRYPDEELKDETFDGAIWAMAVPQDFLELAEEISRWIDSKSNQNNSPYISESFGGYSYTKATTASGNIAGWRDIFSDRLRRYRKLRII